MSTTIKTNIGNCARCGSDHDGLEFTPFARPVVLARSAGIAAVTHWALCPVTGEPIMLHIVSDEVPLQMSLEGVLDAAYANETNVQISCFFDDGWTIKLGDRINGFTATAYAQDASQLAAALDGLIREHEPVPLENNTEYARLKAIADRWRQKGV